MVLLPIKPGGVTHQHFNRNGPDDPAEWLAINYLPHSFQLGAQFTHNEVSNDWDATHSDAMDADDHDHGHSHGNRGSSGDCSAPLENFDYADWLDYEEPDSVKTLYEDLIIRRNRFRQQMAQSQAAGNWGLLTDAQTEWESNPQGKMKWYLHPAFEDRSIRTLIAAVQEIPPGSRSGKQHRQGGVTHYVLKGKGHTVIGGQRWDWTADDYIGLPLNPEGLTVQHFNDSPDKPARLLVAEPGWSAQLGIDKGCGFEQLILSAIVT
jgi:gentisate 1,2-dioxygenase